MREDESSLTTKIDDYILTRTQSFTDNSDFGILAEYGTYSNTGPWTSIFQGNWSYSSLEPWIEECKRLPKGKLLWENRKWSIRKFNGQILLYVCVKGNWETVSSKVVLANLLWDFNVPIDTLKIAKHVIEKFRTFTRMNRML